MYLAGSPHPNSERAERALDRLAQNGERFITDVGVYQEILHRYGAIRRLDAITSEFQGLDGIVDGFLTYGIPEIHAARPFVESVQGISAREVLPLR
jgi:predicted nucleic acid-binding protein